VRGLPSPPSLRFEPSLSTDPALVSCCFIVTPITSYGRLVVCASILGGVAVIPAQLASLVEALTRRESSRPGAVAPPTANSVVGAAKGQGGLGYGGRPWWGDVVIRDAFERYDVNDSGELDYRELRQALRALGAEVDDREVARILQVHDNDGNGLMDLEEFSNMLQSTSCASLVCFVPPPEPSALGRPPAALACSSCGESVHLNTALFCHRCGSRI